MHKYAREGLGGIWPFRSTRSTVFLALGERLSHTSYANKRAAWRSTGGFTCPHGVCFLNGQGRICPCVRIDDNAHEAETWRMAKKMPAIAHDLKAIVMVPFLVEEYRRIGSLRAEMRRLNYY